jgi:hypothetical protein
VHAGADRHGITRHRRGRALTASFAVAVALATAGCASDADTGSTNSPPLVTGEQVVTSCFQNYFYNGILPRASAQSNCKSCVVDELHKLGVNPASGENAIDMLTGDRLSNSDIQSLQSNCNETDANEQ